MKQIAICIGIRLDTSDENWPYTFTFYGHYPIKEVVIRSSNKTEYILGKQYEVSLSPVFKD